MQTKGPGKNVYYTLYLFSIVIIEIVLLCINVKRHISREMPKMNSTFIVLVIRCRCNLLVLLL